MKKAKESKPKSPPKSENTPDAESKAPETVSIQEIAQEQNERLQKELAEYKDKYVRALADLENTKRRMQTEKQEMIAFAVKDMLAEFLNPLDQFENALAFTDNLSEELQNWAQGFKMILTQFKEVLADQGIRVFDSVGQPFNPHFHEAVDTEETNEVPENTILKERTKGYKQGDKVIRHAHVIVAKKPAEKLEEADLQKEK